MMKVILQEYHQQDLVADLIIIIKNPIEKKAITADLIKSVSIPSFNKSYFKISELSNTTSEINKFLLLPNDIINVYSDPKDNYTNSIYISGSVYHPGSYPILSSNEKVSNIINRAGGLLPEAYPLASTFVREGKSINVSFCETLKFEKVTGSNNKADAKIAGITPAILIFSGKYDESPPYILFPICLLG